MKMCFVKWVISPFYKTFLFAQALGPHDGIGTSEA
jgi:hypothetical protein